MAGCARLDWYVGLQWWTQFSIPGAGDRAQFSAFGVGVGVGDRCRDGSAGLIW